LKFEVGAYRSDARASLKQMTGTQDSEYHVTAVVTSIMNSAALLQQEHQDDLRRATRTVIKRVEKCIEVDGGIFEHLL